jgi:hypothetical protein
MPSDLSRERRTGWLREMGNAAKRVSFFVRWYDLWIGAYYDRVGRVWYICPLPMVGVRIARRSLVRRFR